MSGGRSRKVASPRSRSSQNAAAKCAACVQPDLGRVRPINPRAMCSMSASEPGSDIVGLLRRAGGARMNPADGGFCESGCSERFGLQAADSERTHALPATLLRGDCCLRAVLIMNPTLSGNSAAVKAGAPQPSNPDTGARLTCPSPQHFAIILLLGPDYVEIREGPPVNRHCP